MFKSFADEACELIAEGHRLQQRFDDFCGDDGTGEFIEAFETYTNARLALMAGILRYSAFYGVTPSFAYLDMRGSGGVGNLIGVENTCRWLTDSPLDNNDYENLAIWIDNQLYERGKAFHRKLAIAEFARWMPAQSQVGCLNWLENYEIDSDVDFHQGTIYPLFDEDGEWIGHTIECTDDGGAYDEIRLTHDEVELFSKVLRGDSIV